APVVEVAQSEPEGGRYALVIGNADYDELADLAKSTADARDYASLFERKGYTVTLGLDLSNQDMRIAVAEFAAQLEPGDTAVFVFAGHGWSDGQQNFLIGTDTPLRAS